MTAGARWLTVAGIVLLPALVLAVALDTEIGPTIVEFGWSPGEGLHLGDAITLLIAAPLWLGAVRHGWQSWGKS